MERLKGLFLGLLACLALAGCKTVKYVPVETVRTDSVYATDSSVVNTIIHYKDSLRIKDSIVIVVDTAGNVLSKEKYHDEKYAKDTERSNNETTIKEKDARSADSVEVPVPVEKPLTWWQKFRQEAFWWLVGALGTLGLLIIRKLRKR